MDATHDIDIAVFRLSVYDTPVLCLNAWAYSQNYLSIAYIEWTS